MSPHKALTEAGLRRKYLQVPADDVGGALAALIRHYGRHVVEAALTNLKSGAHPPILLVGVVPGVVALGAASAGRGSSEATS